MTAVMAEHNAKTVISICTARLNLIHQTLSANAACKAFHLLVGLTQKDFENRVFPIIVNVVKPLAESVSDFEVGHITFLAIAWTNILDP